MRCCIAALSTRQQVEFLEPGVAQSLPIGQQGGQIARRLPGDFIGGGRRGAVGALGDSQGGAHQRRHPSNGGSSGGSSAASTPAAAAGAENTGGIGVERIEFRRDFRRGKRIGNDERLVQWRKPDCRATMISAEQWDRLPEALTLRLVRCRFQIPGFRTRQVILVTTLLDSVKYPPAVLGQLYYRRWAMELTLHNLKTTLQMDQLSCKTPQNLEREIRMHFLVHNLVRRLMLEAARRHQVRLERVSFAGSLAAARRYGEALWQAPSERRRRHLQDELFRVLAADLVPDRPGRREPRAVKRRPKPYPRLMCHRSRFREIQHQNRYYAKSVSGARYRNSSRP